MTITEAEKNITGDDSFRGVLPADFVTAAATASYQIEGAYNEDGKGLTNWDVFLADKENGNDAVKSYKYYKEDVKLLKQYGMQAYRFSIAWARVKPLGGKDDPVNEKGIKYYNNLIDQLLANGIEPCVTLFHWDLPIELDKRYEGFADPSQLVPDFISYARLCFERFGDRVKTWITHNEPLIYTMNNQINFHVDDFDEEKYINTTKSILLSHAHTVDMYRREFQPQQQGKIAITLNCDWLVPIDDSEEAKRATEIGINHQFGMYADPIYKGRFPSTAIDRFGPDLDFTPEEWALIKGSNEFFGLNHYSTAYCTGKLLDYDTAAPVMRTLGLVEITAVNKDGVKIGHQGQNGHPTQVPWGFRLLLQHIHNTYSKDAGHRLYITENGFAPRDEGERPFEEIIHDTERQTYISLYLKEVAEAVRDDGIDIAGYMCWSLLDNLEWTAGFAARFGITFVDRSTEEYKRIPKDSAFMLQRVFAHLKKQ